LEAVVKVGGSILRSCRSYFDNAFMIKQMFVERGVKSFIVVSAMRGVTDLLVDVCKGRREALTEVLKMHEELASCFSSSKLKRRIYDVLNEVTRIATLNLSSSRSLPPYIEDYILSQGEKLSKIAMIEALEIEGVKALDVDALQTIVTNGVFGNASIDIAKTRGKLESIWKLAAESNIVPVIEGFIGSSPEGFVTTLGRGGSDYTATAIAAALGLNRVYLVTDVEGVMSADPRIVEGAKLVKFMSVDEAAEAAIYGVKRLNAKAFEPLKLEPGIRVYIGSWKLFGTEISGDARDDAVKILALKDEGSTSRIAVIGEGVKRLETALKMLSLIKDLGYDVLHADFNKYRPSLILEVQREVGIQLLRLLHRTLVEEANNG